MNWKWTQFGIFNSVDTSSLKVSLAKNANCTFIVMKIPALFYCFKLGLYLMNVYTVHILQSI